MDPRTERARNLWNRRAARYDLSEALEGPVLRRTREILCAGARGRTLEVAIGTGRNLRHYPPQVELTGIDLSPEMLDRARERADGLGRPVRLVEGDAQRMEFPDRSFETVVSTLSLCAVPDQRRALEEMYRVLVPGGRLLLVDHVEYTRFPATLLERRREHPRRLPREVASEVGFEVGHHDRLLLGLVERVVAHRPT
ncbi:methyltransferase domain-containing protein [Nocardiopsis sp. EMB25]|uniref:class I SAM-dependent methyltransferase n=1 Tax=Nocardiopsis TaxID=2013 RepID=UPI00034B1D8B|nr:MULTISPECIES: class I SAM-dependent methyltransferase [Nocardiopsis]MCY9785498.1 methyltransferase domain-containing protein [Nocardiopsis sp. EMB25]